MRGSSLEKSMSSYLSERVRATPNIDVHLGSTVVRADGDGRLESLLIASDGKEVRTPAAGLSCSSVAFR